MFKKIKGRFVAVAPVATGLALVSGGAMAGGGGSVAIDVADVVAQINAAISPIGLIGGSVLLVLVAIKAYKWVRRAM